MQRIWKPAVAVAIVIAALTYAFSEVSAVNPREPDSRSAADVAQPIQQDATRARVERRVTTSDPAGSGVLRLQVVGVDGPDRTPIARARLFRVAEETRRLDASHVVAESDDDGMMTVADAGNLLVDGRMLAVSAPGWMGKSVQELIERGLSGAAEAFQVVELTRGARVSLRCTLDDGSPLPGVRMALSEHRVGSVIEIGEGSDHSVPTTCFLYAGESGEDGMLHIEGMPSGEYRFGIWHGECVPVSELPDSGTWSVADETQHTEVVFRRLVAAVVVGPPGAVAGSSVSGPVKGYVTDRPDIHLACSVVHGAILEKWPGAAAFVGLPSDESPGLPATVTCKFAFKSGEIIEEAYTPLPLRWSSLAPYVCTPSASRAGGGTLRIDIHDADGTPLVGVPMTIAGHGIAFEGRSGEVVDLPLGAYIYFCAVDAANVGMEIGDCQVAITDSDRHVVRSHSLQGRYRELRVRWALPYEEKGLRLNLTWEEAQENFSRLNVRTDGDPCKMWVSSDGDVTLSASALGLASPEVVVPRQVSEVVLDIEVRR